MSSVQKTTQGVVVRQIDEHKNKLLENERFSRRETIQGMHLATSRKNELNTSPVQELLNLLLHVCGRIMGTAFRIEHFATWVWRLTNLLGERERERENYTVIMSAYHMRTKWEVDWMQIKGNNETSRRKMGKKKEEEAGTSSYPGKWKLNFTSALSKASLKEDQWKDYLHNTERD